MLKKIVAKKDFHIFQNGESYVIKEGDDIVKLGIPERFYPNLQTEKVIDGGNNDGTGTT